MKVLIVDDGETNRQLLEVLLCRAGARVKAAKNGQEALEMIARQDFDAVLMDMQMPVLDGYSATRELRARRVSIPVIALTAHAMAGEREKCLEAGCDSYLTKPVSQEQLVQTLSQLTASESQRSSKWEGLWEHPDQEMRSSLDITDPEIFGILSQFIAHLPDRIGTIRQAWQVRDWCSLDQQTHCLKGTAATMGFPLLSQAVGRLETVVLERNAAITEMAIQQVEDVAKKICDLASVAC